ncbi:hypothetical protein BIV59_17540 [Bacillus sp. MUM 13]|nr:hypothetical protein BIV59_17540 [Bacillus sp. MUM 13]
MVGDGHIRRFIQLWLSGGSSQKASTAYQLAKMGAEVLIIDRRDEGQATDAAAASAGGSSPELFEIPRSIVKEGDVTHPVYPWFENLGLKGYGVRSFPICALKKAAFLTWPLLLMAGTW